MNDNELSHYATCAVWETGSWANCNCKGQAPWKVRKEPDEQFPWRIWRFTDDGTYEHMMRASTWQKAMGLIDGLVEIRRHAFESSMSERSAMWQGRVRQLGDLDG